MKIIFLITVLMIFSRGANAFGLFPLGINGVSGCQQYINQTQTDNSNITNGFAGGTMSNVTWDGSKLVLSASQTLGTFTSRVFDSGLCTHVAPWMGFSWATTLPYFKELTPTNESSAAYSGLSAGLMSGLMGLWHLNEASYNGTANEAVDSSGNGYHGALVGSGSVTNVAGLFNNAANLAGTLNEIDISTLPAMTDTLTYSFWVNTTDATLWNGFVFRRNTYGWVIQNDQVGNGMPYVRIDTDGGANQTNCLATSSVTDGKWHHIAVVINSGSCKLYIDSQKQSDVSYTLGSGFTGVAAPLQISTGGGGWGVTGRYDEAALWSRALSDTEILELYRRGAGRVKFQVRSCTTSNCGDNPAWIGSDGSNATTISELNNSLTTAPSMNFFTFNGFVALIQRYFQYQITLQTDNTTYSPDVSSVTVKRPPMIPRFKSPTNIQSKGLHCGTVSTCGLAFTSSNTAGNTIIVAGRLHGIGMTITITDTLGNTYVMDKTQTLATDVDTIFVAHASNIAAGANTVTVAFTGGPATERILIHEYANLATSPVDQFASANNTGAAISTGNTPTTTQAIELLFGFTANSNSGSISATPGASYTMRVLQDCGGNKCLASEDRVVTSAGAYSAAFTQVSPEWGAILVTYKALAW